MCWYIHFLYTVDYFLFVSGFVAGDRTETAVFHLMTLAVFKTGLGSLILSLCSYCSRFLKQILLLGLKMNLSKLIFELLPSRDFEFLNFPVRTLLITDGCISVRAGSVKAPLGFSGIEVDKSVHSFILSFTNFV